MVTCRAQGGAQGLVLQRGNILRPREIVFLRLLLDWCGGMRCAVGRSGNARASALGCWRRCLCVFAFIIVVLINIHVARCRLVLFRSLLLWGFRHARRWWRRGHGWQGRRMVGGFRRVVAVVEAACIWGAMWAVTRNLGRRHRVWRGRTTAVWLLELLALLLILRRLGVGVLVFFPLAVSLGWGGRRAVIPIPSRSFCSHHCRCWRRSAACNAAAGRGVGVMLVWPLVSVAW